MTRAKKARSVFRGGQGRVPRRPMPREGVVATMRVRGGRGGGMVLDEEEEKGGGGGGGGGILGLGWMLVRFWTCTSTLRKSSIKTSQLSI